MQQRDELELVDQPRGAAEPSPRRREVTQARAVEQAQVDGRQCRLVGLRAPAKSRVGMFQAAHRGVGLAQPPQDVAKAGQRLGRLLLLERSFKRGLDGGPVARLEGLLCLSEKS